MNHRFTVPDPCHERKWTDLAGEGRARFCSDCGRHVHALDQYSADELKLLQASGRFCGYIARVPTQEARSRRAVLVGALLTAISPLMAESGSVRIRVKDATGEAVSSAQAVLLTADGKPRLSVKADAHGEILFSNLPVGVARFDVSCPGFNTSHLSVPVGPSEEVAVGTTLQIGTMGTVVEAAPPKK